MIKASAVCGDGESELEGDEVEEACATKGSPAVRTG